MRRTLPLAFLAAAVVLTGCGTHDNAAPTGPPTTTATPLQPESELAARYRKSGGDTDVQGIRQEKNQKGVPALTVWTRKKSGYDDFDAFATKLTSFLSREGAAFPRGYLLNVYGPDGTRLHTYDTTPEHNP